jgi:hypothetical protein
VGARFSAPVQTGPGAHPASCTGSFPGVKCGRVVLLTTHPLLAPRSWKSRAIPLPPLDHNRACNRVTLPFYMYIYTYARRHARPGSCCSPSIHVWLRAWPLKLYPEGRFISRNSVLYIISAPINSKWCIHKPFHNQNIVHVFLSCMFCKCYSCRSKYPGVTGCGKQSSLLCLRGCNKRKTRISEKNL